MNINGIPVLLLTTAALLSSLLYIILKFFHQKKVNNLHGLTVNYITACAFSLISASISGSPIQETIIDHGAIALFIGLLFIVVFYLAAMTAQTAGIAITSIAGKMSMVIPILAGVWLFGDQLTAVRIVGIVLALVAVYLTSAGHANKSKHHPGKFWVYPVLLFIGSGMVDTSIKISQAFYIQPNTQDVFFGLLFGSAGLFGMGVLIYQQVKGAPAIQLQSILGGILLGITNYYSLVFLVRCLAAPGAESALIFAMVNMLVVLFSSVLAFFLFHEKPAAKNLLGILLAIVAIFILSC